MTSSLPFRHPPHSPFDKIEHLCYSPTHDSLPPAPRGSIRNLSSPARFKAVSFQTKPFFTRVASCAKREMMRRCVKESDGQAAGRAPWRTCIRLSAAPPRFDRSSRLTGRGFAASAPLACRPETGKASVGRHPYRRESFFAKPNHFSLVCAASAQRGVVRLGGL